MHESDIPAPVADDGVLDGFATDLDDVAAALDALDADDLDAAEALVAGLASPESGDTDTEPV